MEHTVLFRTVHGSRLYGLHHPNSDYDYYTVVDKVRTARAKYAKHTIVDGLDSTVLDFGTWVHQMQMGVPQALEACFSTMADIDHISAYRAQVRVGYGALERYFRTIKSFALEDAFKHKRHALRLAMNVRDLRRYGRFNPTLSHTMAALLGNLAQQPGEYVYHDALFLAQQPLDMIVPRV